MNYDLEHPIVTAMERSGWPGGREPEHPVCPVCGEECETMHKDRYGAYVGCDVCMTAIDAWEVDDCFPEERSR